MKITTTVSGVVLTLALTAQIAIGATHTQSKKAGSSEAVQGPAPTLEVMGLTIGSAISDIPECPMLSSTVIDGTTWANNNRKPCREPATFGKTVRDKDYVYHLDLPGTFDPETKVFLTSLDDQVQAVIIDTQGVKDQDSVFQILKQKYGKPLQFNSVSNQTMAGVTYSSIHAIWVFSDLNIVFAGTSSRIDNGEAIIETPVMARYLADVKKKAESSGTQF